MRAWLLALPALLIAPLALGQVTLSIEGTVTHEITGSPIAGARVVSLSTGRLPGNTFSFTDAAGRFHIEGLAAGPRCLAISRTGYVPVRRTVTLAAFQNLTGLKIALTPQAVIAGRVTDRDGWPAEGSRIGVLQLDANGALSPIQRIIVSTDDRGEFRIGGLSPGRYCVRAEPASGIDGGESYVETYYPAALTAKDAGQIELKTGEERSGIVVQLQKVVTVRVQGRVILPSGYADPRSAVSLTTAFVAGSSRTTITQIEADGRFTFENVKPGSYHIEPQLPPPYGRGWSGAPNTVTNLEVGSSDITGLVLNAESTIPVNIPGTVVFDAGAKRVPLIIQLTRNSDVEAQTASLEDGSFTLRDVLPGKYRLRAKGGGRSADSARLDDVDLPYGDIEVKRPNPGKLVLTVTSAAGSVEGVVVNQAGQPAAGKYVVFRASKPGLVPARITRTDSDGHFMVKLAPKEYHVQAVEKLPDDPWADRGPTQGQVVTIVEGNNPPLRLVLATP
jgi:hypothetical protein